MRRIATSFVILASVPACKPKAAKMKSLDDLPAGGHLRLQVNLCSGDPNVPPSTYSGLVGQGD